MRCDFFKYCYNKHENTEQNQNQNQGLCVCASTFPPLSPGFLQHLNQRCLHSLRLWRCRRSLDWTQTLHHRHKQVTVTLYFQTFHSWKKKNNSIHTLPPWLSEPVSLTRSSWSHSRVCVCAVLGLRHVCLTFHLLNVHLRVSRKTFISQLSDSAFCRKFSCAFKGDVCVFFKEILEKTSMNLAGWNVYIYICILLETLRKWRGRPDLSDSVDPFLQFFSRHTASDDLQGNSILSYEEAGRHTQHRVFKEWEVKEVWLNSPDCHQFLCFFFLLYQSNNLQINDG